MSIGLAPLVRLSSLKKEDKRALLKIGTHDGDFHCDEVLALSLIKHFYGDLYDITIIRTRDKDILNTCDMLVDVGGEYDGVRFFDHHQDKNLKCSASLVWTAIGERFGFENEYVNKYILDGLSALDCDYMDALENRGDPNLYYNLSTLIWDLNNIPDGFEKALEIGGTIWTANFIKMEKLKHETKIIWEGEKKGPLLILSEGMDIKNHVNLLNDFEVTYVIHPHYNPLKWCLKTVNSLHYPLPEVKGAEYVHATRFLAIFSNKETLEQNYNLLV